MFVQPFQQPGGHGVELADMAGGERPQKRSQRRRAYGRAKTVPIAPWRNRAMSAMLPAAATMPATRALTPRPGVGAFVGRHAEPTGRLVVIASTKLAESDPREISLCHRNSTFRRHDPLPTATEPVHSG